jgi:hypothetical protein
MNTEITNTPAVDPAIHPTVIPGTEVKTEPKTFVQPDEDFAGETITHQM